MFKSVVMIDGGYLRAVSTAARFKYTPPFIQAVARQCHNPGEESLLKILYYDCPPFAGELTYPVSSKKEKRTPDAHWLNELSRMDYFAVRLGTVKFRGLTLLKVPPPPRALTDENFKPVFEQKGVDMRIGIDIASMSERAIVERVVLLSGDTDMVPAMKHARKCGIQVVAVELPDRRLPSDLLTHADIHRKIDRPPEFKPQ